MITILKARNIKRNLKKEFPKAIISMTSLDTNSYEKNQINILIKKSKKLSHIVKINYSLKNNTIDIIESHNPSISEIKSGKSEGSIRMEIPEYNFENSTEIYA